MSETTAQKCCSLRKQNLFSDQNPNECHLKEDVIYRRSYTLRPTLAIDTKNASNKSNTKDIKHSMVPTTQKEKKCFVNKAKRDLKATKAIKPVIEAKTSIKPKAIHLNDSRDEELFRASDARRRYARSVSLPSIAIPSKRSTESDTTGKESSEEMMNQIRRRVSQIIDSNLLSDLSAQQKARHSRKSKSKMKEQMIEEPMTTTTDEKQNEDTINNKLFNLIKQRQESDDKSIQTSNINEYIKRLEELNKLVNERQENMVYKKYNENENMFKTRFNEKHKLNFNQTEDNKRLSANDYIKRKYCENLSKNSLSLIQNCYFTED